MKRFLIFNFICNWVHMGVVIFVHPSSLCSWFWYQKELHCLFISIQNNRTNFCIVFKRWLKNVKLFFLQKLGSSYTSVKVGWNNLIQKLTPNLHLIHMFCHILHLRKTMKAKFIKTLSLDTVQKTKSPCKCVQYRLICQEKNNTASGCASGK